MFEKSLNRSDGIGVVVRPVLIGTVAAIIICILFSFLASAIMAIFKVFSEYAVVPLAVAALAVGVFFGAWITAKLTRRRGLLSGVIIGAAVTVMLLIVGLFGSESLLGSITWIKFGVIIFAGAAGGYFSVNHS